MSDSIPDSTNEHQGSTTKGVPLPRPRKVLVDENDLWNLEDDLSDSATPAPAEQRPSIPAGIPQRHSSDYITRIEPNAHDTPKYASQEDPIESLPDEWPEVETANGFIPVLESATETPAVSAKKPMPYSPVEDDVWSDFDDAEDEPAHRAVEEPPSQQAAVIDESTVSLGAQTEETNFPEDPVAYEPEPSIAAAPVWTEPLPEPAVAESAAIERTEPVESPLSDSTDETAADDTPVDELATEHAETEEHDNEHHAPVDWRALAGPSWHSITKFELTAIISSFVVLAILAVAGLIIFRTDIRTQDNPFLRASMPAKGEIATIESYETYWRKPRREGPNADAARLDIISIPEVQITLGESAKASGVIRVIFYNDAGEMAGDTLTCGFQQGKFVDNSQKSITFAATTGFRSFGEQEAYRARQTLPWTIRVYEGADENAPSSSFRLLFSSAISTNRK
jgi:hypothetical protein